jgi:predicted peroxiredoxin
MNGKKVLYIQTSGLEEPGRANAPFILAIDAVATGTQATIYFFLRGVTIMKKGEPEKAKLEGYPPLDRIIQHAVHSGVTLEACEQSCALFGLEKQELIDQVRTVGPSSLNDRILDANGTVSF